MRTDFIKNKVKDAGKANKSLSLIVKMKPRRTRFSAAFFSARYKRYIAEVSSSFCTRLQNLIIGSRFHQIARF